jgi:transcriptional regulator with XRE-family HTH domain
MTFAELVISRRSELNLTARDLAKEAGLAEKALAAIENGQGWPPPRPLGRLAIVLDLDEAALVEAAEAEMWGDGPRGFSLCESELDAEADAAEYVTRAQWREMRAAFRQARRDAEARSKSKPAPASRGSRASMPGKPTFGKKKAG